MKLFLVLEVYKGRRCYWYVASRKQEDANVPAAEREFFTEREAAVFVKFARRHLQIPRLTVVPMTTPPTKSFSERIMEAGQKPDILTVGFGADADFCVGAFEDPEDPKHQAEVEAALADLEKTGMVESSPGDHPGERLYTLTEKGRKRRGRA